MAISVLRRAYLYLSSRGGGGGGAGRDFNGLEMAGMV